MKYAFSLVALIAASPAFAEETRQLDAHEHGVGSLNIAVEGETVAMEFEAPGADVVGFEYEATTDADKSAVQAAVAKLGAPLDLFVMPDAAKCSVVSAKAELESEHHDDHADHEDHDDEEHAKHDDHEDHDDEEHAEHEEHDHDGHEDEAGHTEFHAEYSLTCSNPDALTNISFAYFDMFPNAKEVEVQIITASGAKAFEVTKDAPVLDLGR